VVTINRTRKDSCEKLRTHTCFTALDRHLRHGEQSGAANARCTLGQALRAHRLKRMELFHTESQTHTIPP